MNEKTKISSFVIVLVVPHDGGLVVAHDGGLVVPHDGGLVVPHDGGFVTKPRGCREQKDSACPCTQSRNYPP